MKNTIFSLLFLLMGVGLLPGDEPGKGDLGDLIRQMQSHPEQDFSKFIGKTFDLEGDLYGERKDLQNIRVEIYVPSGNGRTNVDSGILAVIAMGDTTKIIHYPGGGLEIKSTGVLQSVDAKSKTITLKSDAKLTFVNEAD